MTAVLLRCGRLRLILEPRDIWLGVYVAPGAVYVCLIPCLPVKWERKPRREVLYVRDVTHPDGECPLHGTQGECPCLDTGL